MKHLLQLLLIFGMLTLSFDLQAVSSDKVKKTETVNGFIQKIKSVTKTYKIQVKQFIKKQRKRIKQATKKGEKKGMITAAIISLLLIATMLTFILLKIGAIITWPWVVVLIPLYVIVLLVLYSSIPLKSK